MNNSHFVIGEDECEFDIVFAPSGRGSIQIYGNLHGSQNIEGLTIINNIHNVEEIINIDQHEFSFNVRAYTGNFVLLKNSFGNFAALKIKKALSISHGDEKDSVDFDYWILRTNKSV
jgi:hypothetical protein